MSNRKQNGFTLIEAMIAMAIFAFMGVSAYAILDNIVRVQAQSDEKSIQMASMQKVTWQIGQDFRHMVRRNIKDVDDNPLEWIELDGSDYIVEFTRGGWANPLGWPRSSMQRVAYSIDFHPESEDSESSFFNDERLYLIRHYWQALDRGLDSEPRQQAMLADINDFYLRFYDPNKADDPWSTTIVTKDGIGSSGVTVKTGAFDLPFAVEVNFVLGEEDLYSYILPVRYGGN